MIIYFYIREKFSGLKRQKWKQNIKKKFRIGVVFCLFGEPLIIWEMWPLLDSCFDKYLLQIYLPVQCSMVDFVGKEKKVTCNMHSSDLQLEWKKKLKCNKPFVFIVHVQNEIRGDLKSNSTFPLFFKVKNFIENSWNWFFHINAKWSVSRF